MRRQHERRIRGGVILAELGPDDLDAFLEECRRERRTTGFLGGRIISDWLKRRAENAEGTGQDDRHQEEATE